MINPNIQNKKVLLIDFDGVIVDLTGHILNRINDKFNTKYKNSDISVWEFHKHGSPVFKKDEHRQMAEDLFVEQGLTSELPFVDGSLAALEALQKSEKYSIIFVSVPYDLSPTWCYDRTKWFKKSFLKDISRELIYTASKHLIRGDILIDDKPSNIVNWNKTIYSEFPDKYGILLNQPWNKDFISGPKEPFLLRAKNWSDILRILNINI